MTNNKKYSAGPGAASAHMAPALQLALLRAPKRNPVTGVDPVQIFEGRQAPPPSDFERAYAAFPPPVRPETYDFRGRSGKAEPIAISRLGPQDRVVTDGADVTMSPTGPVVLLHEGYANGRSAARTGPVLVPDGPAT